MIESFVDVTVRGLSLGRRIKLCQVRPSSGYLELPSPMPVGTHVAIATDDGVQFAAIVTWVHEQVVGSAGSERPPGMVVVPELAAESASAWWTARVVLPDEDQPRPRSARSRPVTVRPRAHTRPTPPPSDAITSPIIDEAPTIVADLDARIAVAAGVAPAKPTGGADPRAVVTNAVDHEPPERMASPEAEPEPVMRRTGEHEVVDDGYQTMIMESVDPAALGLDASTPGDAAAPGDRDAGDAGDDSDLAEPTDPGGPAPAGDDRPAARRGWFKKRKPRR